jgi:hypothetical protein
MPSQSRFPLSPFLGTNPQLKLALLPNWAFVGTIRRHYFWTARHPAAIGIIARVELQ